MNAGPRTLRQYLTDLYSLKFSVSLEGAEFKDYLKQLWRVTVSPAGNIMNICTAKYRTLYSRDYYKITTIKLPDGYLMGNHLFTNSNTRNCDYNIIILGFKYFFHELWSWVCSHRQIGSYSTQVAHCVSLSVRVAAAAGWICRHGLHIIFVLLVVAWGLQSKVVAMVRW